jgi:hypothetical protein
MLIKTTETKETITLLFRAAKNPKAVNPRLEASKEFSTDLAAFLKEKYKTESPCSINFMHELDIIDINVINEQGKISKQYQVELVLQKEPAQADTSNKK